MPAGVAQLATVCAVVGRSPNTVPLWPIELFALSSCGVGQEDRVTTSLKFPLIVLPGRLGWLSRFSYSIGGSVSMHCGVGQEANWAVTCRLVIAVLFAPDPSLSPIRFFIARWASGVLLSSFATGVGHEVKPLPDVRRPEARSAQIQTPDGVALSFQISVNKVEPSKAVLGRNLFTKYRCRTADFDEVVPRRPEMPLVSSPRSFACRAERLARAGAGPDRPFIGPSGAAQGVGPGADPGEEVALGVSHKFVWPNVLDGSLIDYPVRYRSRFYQFPEPCCFFAVDLVIIDHRSGIEPPRRMSGLDFLPPDPVAQDCLLGFPLELFLALRADAVGFPLPRLLPDDPLVLVKPFADDFHFGPQMMIRITGGVK
jgi:hypothetical protein